MGRPPASFSMVRALGLFAVGFAAAFGGWKAWSWATAPKPSSVPYRLPAVAGNVDVEIAFYRARVARDPGAYTDQVALGDAYLRKARLSSQPAHYLLAEQAARRSLAAKPERNPDAEMLLVRTAIARHRFDEAGARLAGLGKQGFALPGMDAAALTIALATGDMDRAATLANKLMRRVPATETYVQAGLVALANGQDDEAEKAFRRAIEREQAGETESSAMARAGLGRLRLERGRLDEAQDFLGEAARILPENAAIASLRGTLALRRGEWAAAEGLFALAHRVDGSAAHLGGKALALAGAGDLAAAAAARDAAIAGLRADLATSDLGHRRDLARLLLQRGGPGDAAAAEALTAAELALRRDAETVRVRAWALGALGRWAAASDVLAPALDTFPGSAPLAAAAAWVSAGRGDAATAATWMERVRALDPTMPADPAAANARGGAV